MNLAPHLNNRLFSDYYLLHLIQQEVAWESLLAEAIAVKHDIQKLLATLKPAQLDEAQLEQRWIQPVLERLGHHYSVQVKIRYGEKGLRKPDYMLAATADEVRFFGSEIYTPDQIQAHAIGLADAKKWGVHLDQASKNERNPSQQIDEYLHHSELQWGILTDGRYWRLYERKSSKNNDYYAVDLVALLDGSDEDFLYFYAFFRQGAFIEGWLETVLAGSERYAQEVTEKLEEQVYDALELIAQGFLVYRRNRLDASSANLQTIYENSLVLLYRLLFVFYAESRAILPTDNLKYVKQHSLEGVTRDIVANPLTDNPDSTIFFIRLKDLFFSIDQGNPAYDIPIYNGKLFSIEQHPFLDEKLLGDTYFAPALDKMARIVNNGRLEFIDYRDLDVRHLGAIYEKLLEYQLDIATQPLVLKKGVYAVAGKNDTPLKQAGEVYLRTGNNERKISGSYYTPDYIVRFIIEKTLTPLLTQITQRYATLDAEGHWQVHQPAELLHAILDINILDPATGSGHFMVEATAYVAEWLRQLKIAPANLPAEEDELVYWKRQVVNACIYGVDVNPLAVELAKLALWLATLAKGKPLSFLNHHLKVGNSLVGVRAKEIDANLIPVETERKYRGKPNDAPLFAGLEQDDQFSPAVKFAVGKMTAIEQAIVETIDIVRAQEEKYLALQAQMAFWKEVADVWTARYFGLNLTQPQWSAIRQHKHDKATRAIVERATELARQHTFFHWELEFPEVFYTPEGKRREDAGFDVVIGNPPYVRQEHLKPIKNFLEVKYDIYQGTADLFLYFYEQGLRMLKAEQKLGYIVGGTYMNTNSAKEFRQYIHKNASFDTFVDFGDIRLFRGVDLATTSTVTILRKGKGGNTFPALIIESEPLPQSLNEALAQDGIEVLSDVTGMEEWRFQDAELTNLFRKITQTPLNLMDRLGGKIYSGIKTGLNEVFIIDEARKDELIRQHPSSQEIIKPMRRGLDLRPWYQMQSHEYLVSAYQGIEIQKYPAIYDYLSQHKDALAQRSEALAGQCDWYELRPCDYYDVFEAPKILWADISKYPRFSRNAGYYLGNTAFMIADARYSTLALLQSRTLWFVLTQIATVISKRAGLWQYRALPQFVERLPIPELTPQQESELAELAEQATELAKKRYQFHEDMRYRFRADLSQGADLNEKLWSWWELPPQDLRTEVKKAFKRDIPVKERREWEEYHTDQIREHDTLTAQLVEIEKRINAVVYAAFQLNADEIALIEKTTKYPYGAV